MLNIMPCGSGTKASCVCRIKIRCIKLFKTIIVELIIKLIQYNDHASALEKLSLV